DVSSTVSLGKRPRGIHPGPDGKLLYVALSGHPFSPPGIDESTLPPPDKTADGVAVLDIRQNKTVRAISGGSNPEQLALSKDGKLVYVADQEADGLSTIDLASGQVLNTLQTGEEPEGVTITPDGKFVFVTSEDEGTITQIDTALAKVVKQVKACNHPRTVIPTPDSAHVVIACESDGNILVMDVTKLEPLQTIVLGKSYKPMGMALTKDGTTLYVTTGRAKTLFAIDLPVARIQYSISLPGARSWGLALSPDERLLFTANGPSHDVSVIDIAAHKVVKNIKAGTLPWGVIAVALTDPQPRVR
ncbi:MAG TPA: beta-propeller fold lactonase family protein, partial [Bryobacteraceae bacterium]|nr:beta-propeller fold lactonase family protein [Bryobacteraceae bacterium]